MSAANTPPTPETRKKEVARILTYLPFKTIDNLKITVEKKEEEKLKIALGILDISELKEDTDINRIFKDIALLVHPDKFNKPDDKEEAGNAFLVLSSAKDVAVKAQGHLRASAKPAKAMLKSFTPANKAKIIDHLAKIPGLANNLDFASIDTSINVNQPIVLNMAECKRAVLNDAFAILKMLLQKNNAGNEVTLEQLEHGGASIKITHTGQSNLIALSKDYIDHDVINFYLHKITGYDWVPTTGGGWSLTEPETDKTEKLQNAATYLSAALGKLGEIPIQGNEAGHTINIESGDIDKLIELANDGSLSGDLTRYTPDRSHTSKM